MNNEFVMIAPAIDAFTRTYWPACHAANPVSSSVRLPSVALSNPPTISPVRVATDSPGSAGRRAARQRQCKAETELFVRRARRSLLRAPRGQARAATELDYAGSRSIRESGSVPDNWQC